MKEREEDVVVLGLMAKRKFEVFAKLAGSRDKARGAKVLAVTARRQAHGRPQR